MTLQQILLYVYLFSLIISFSLVVGDNADTRAKALLAQMTAAEKFSLVYGVSGSYVGNQQAVSRLNIPKLNLEDGPQGVADGVRGTTAWPSALTVVATWNVESMRTWAVAMATEQRMKGTNVMLGPMINIARVPVGGRNFESFGEDPHLTSMMVIQSVKGIQSEGVIACAKHYVANNQEANRTQTSANVPARAMWEIYYPGFQAAVNAGVGSVMCSYNKINDTYACENKQTLTMDLKQKMGFKGYVMSDWGATHSTVNAANNGLDQQMADNKFFGPALVTAVNNGSVPQSRVDDMVNRILWAMYSVGIMDTTQSGDLSVVSTSNAHNVLARNLAAEAHVLLKNNGILPLNPPANGYVIAVLGDDCHDAPISVGGGSGGVQLPYQINPLDGITSRAGTGVKIVYANTTNSQAAQIAQAANVAIVCAGVHSSEGSDRSTLSLGTPQNNLITNVAAVQKNTIVVLHGPGALLMPWLSSVAAVVHGFYPGQENGNALASVLWGDVNPSGKLPVTFPESDTQTPINTPQQYPGVSNEASYSEELLVGYRWYDAKNQNPLFEFGFGLSYTTFNFDHLTVAGSLTNGVTVTFSVQNQGKVSGAEVSQLYLGYPTSAGEPPKVLRGFNKVLLAPGETKFVSFLLVQKDFSIYDVTKADWAVARGDFTIYVGASCRDIRLKGLVTI